MRQAAFYLQTLPAPLGCSPPAARSIASGAFNWTMGDWNTVEVLAQMNDASLLNTDDNGILQVWQPAPGLLAVTQLRPQ